MPKIGIFSLEADLHAHAILHELKCMGIDGHFFATDSQIEDGGLTWSLLHRNQTILKDYEGVEVYISDLELIWWRRVNQPQKNPELFNDNDSFDLVCNEWRSALFGAVSDSFNGIWVNNPKNDALAGNKIFHLNVAKEAGFTVPDTLVTNDPDKVLEFCKKHNGRIIVKKLQGGANLSLATLELTIDQIQNSKDSIKLAPAMYQEKIEAQKHIRVNCFGKNVFCVQIESEDLDWRRNLNCNFEEIDLGKDLNKKLSKLLSNLELHIGIMDLIVTDNGVVWLEINPQGQFLFAEGLSGLNLKRKCADFLHQMVLSATANKANALGR